MSQVVVCAEPQHLAQAGKFAASVLGGGQVRTFQDVMHRVPKRPVVVYLKRPNYERVRALLKLLGTDGLDVVLYCAASPGPEEAVQLGRLVGEVRPKHTQITFEPKAVASLLAVATADQDVAGASPAAVDTRTLRDWFGMTQGEMAQALGVSLRTVQNWERVGNVAKPNRLRDLAELKSVLSHAMERRDVPTWLQTRNDALQGQTPIELILDGKARDIIVEFRRLQAGEPV